MWKGIGISIIVGDGVEPNKLVLSLWPMKPV